MYLKLSKNYYNDDPIAQANFSVPNMGLINDEDYCEKIDLLNYQNPLNYTSQINVLTDYNADGLVRQLVIK